MLAVPGYTVQEQIHRGRRSTVFRAQAVNDQRRVVLKVSPSASADPAALVRFRHEFRLGTTIAHEHVLRYLALEPCGERVALVEEDVGGGSLADLLALGPLGLDTALDIAMKIARGLAEIHAHEVIHRAIYPGNVLVDPARGMTKIIDFADATLIRQHAEPALRARDLTLPLAYISPEQTGRINREVDHRTDIYSLGATLYHMLAGRPPFTGSDPLALVHAHIARVPTPLCELDPRIPEAVSRLVDKLLAKDPEDRYQSAPGIVADLADALRRLRLSGKVELFPLGLADAPDRLELPRRLYGRTDERRHVLEAFELAAAGGKQLVLVAGYSGVGKSSLVHEVRRPIVERRGFFLAGKFDQLHRNVPYAALRAAFQQLCDELLSGSADELRAWKERILARLGANAALVVEVVPELEKVIGPQPAAPPTGLVESQHRFTVAVQRFVGVLAGAAHPVVLFLDDLQWADPATLHVVRALLTSADLTHLLVIGAYRDNEVDAAHPFALALAELRTAGVPMREIALRDLSSDDVEALVADALRAPRAAVAPLARLVFDKTSGNPFFVDEFLRMLARDKRLTFSAAQRAWTWDASAIAALAITANVVALMIDRLQQLPEAVQRALRLAACIGDRFALSTLAQASGGSTNETRAVLEPAIRERFLLPIDTAYPFDAPGELATTPGPDYRYRFQHDRVRQAAYELTPAAQRPALHLSIGRMLLARTPAAARDARVFDIVDQLARGAALVRDPAERLGLAELCLLAGKKARSATAYAEGLAYLRTGLAALPDDGFEAHYDLAYQLHLRAAECAYLAGRFDDADALADVLLPRLRSPLERAQLYTVRIVLEANRTRYDRSVALGIEALAALGIDVPAQPGTPALMRALVRTKLDRFRTRHADLAALPDLDDERLIAAISIIEHLFAPAYFMDPKLFFWLVHACLHISLTRGNAPPSSVGYVSYGLLLAAVMGKYEDADRFGRLGLALAERYAWTERRAKLHVMFGLFIHHFRSPARESLEYVRRAVAEGLESGDIVYACIASANHAEGAAIVGDPLDDVFRLAEAGERFARPLRHGDVNTMFLLLKQFVRCLRDETDGVASLTGQGLDEAALVADVKAAEARIMLAIYLIWKVELLVLFHRPGDAMELVLEFDETIEAMTAGQLRVTEYGFCACLAAIGCLRAKTGTRATRRLLARKRKRLAAWAASGPANYLHKHLLVEAELADLGGDADRATALYDRAIHEARASGYQQHAAFAAELAARVRAARSPRRRRDLRPRGARRLHPLGRDRQGARARWRPARARAGPVAAAGQHQRVARPGQRAARVAGDLERDGPRAAARAHDAAGRRERGRGSRGADRRRGRRAADRGDARRAHRRPRGADRPAPRRLGRAARGHRAVRRADQRGCRARPRRARGRVHARRLRARPRRQVARVPAGPPPGSHDRRAVPRERAHRGRVHPRTPRGAALPGGAGRDLDRERAPVRLDPRAQPGAARQRGPPRRVPRGPAGRRVRARARWRPIVREPQGARDRARRPRAAAAGGVRALRDVHRRERDPVPLEPAAARARAARRDLDGRRRRGARGRSAGAARDVGHADPRRGRQRPLRRRRVPGHRAAARRRARAGAARGAAPDRGAPRVGRAPRRGRGPRLQQPADADDHVLGDGAARAARGLAGPRPDHPGPVLGRARRRPDPAAAGDRAQGGARDHAPRPRGRGRGLHGHAAPPGPRERGDRAPPQWGAVPGARRSRPAAAHPHEPRHERRGRDADRRPADHRDRRHDPHRGGRARPPRRAAGRVRGAPRRRHRHRHGRADAAAHLRAVLHDQAARPGHRSRAPHRARPRRAAPRPPARAQRARRGLGVRDPAAARRAPGARGARGAPRSCRSIARRRAIGRC